TRAATTIGRKRMRDLAGMIASVVRADDDVVARAAVVLAVRAERDDLPALRVEATRAAVDERVAPGVVGADPHEKRVLSRFELRTGRGIDDDREPELLLIEVPLEELERGAIFRAREPNVLLCILEDLRQRHFEQRGLGDTIHLCARLAPALGP